MCRRAVVTALLLLVGAAPLRGQVTAEALQRQIDSLAPLVDGAAVEAARARAEIQEAARAAAQTRRALDTLQVRDVRVIAISTDADQARDLFDQVLAEGFPGVGGRSLSGRTFTYQRMTYDVEGIPAEGYRVAIPGWLSRSRAQARVRAAVGAAIATDLAESRVLDWMSGNPFLEHDPGSIYRAAVVAGSQAVRRCLDGDIDSCESSLGLGLGDDFLDVLYTPAERRTRVAVWAGDEAPFDGRAAPARYQALYGVLLVRCLELRTPDACDAVMARPDLWPPLPTSARESLTRRALERGGPGAWARLTEDPELIPEEALAYAAGMPLDDLVADWRSWIVTNRPEAYAGMGGRSALALMWVLFFAALATRSTRWRFN